MIEIYQNRREVYSRLSGRFRGRLSHLPVCAAAASVGCIDEAMIVAASWSLSLIAIPCRVLSSMGRCTAPRLTPAVPSLAGFLKMAEPIGKPLVLRHHRAHLFEHGC